MPYFVYILESLKDHSYYVGSTQDLDERINRHNGGRSKDTKAKRPWKVVYHEEFPDRSSAMKREKHIKRKKRKGFIEKLLKNGISLPQRCINIWSKSASPGPYQAIKKRLAIFKTSPYVQYAFVLENGQSPFADPIYTVLNSNFMQRWGLL